MGGRDVFDDDLELERNGVGTDGRGDCGHVKAEVLPAGRTAASEHPVRRAARSVQAGRRVGPEHAGHIHPRTVKGQIDTPRDQGQYACTFADTSSATDVDTPVRRYTRCI